MKHSFFLLPLLFLALPAHADDPKAGWASKGCVEKAAIAAEINAKRPKNKNLPTPAFTLSYGPHKAQALDVHLPPRYGRNKPPHPVIFMVHGGGWCMGDKGGDWVVTNKVKRWTPRDFIFVSTNYRMIPDGVYPAGQAEDVAAALAFVQQNAAKWKGDGSKVIAMGHSAGAHLLSLISADMSIAKKHGARPWLGTISLDSGAMDVPRYMTGKHFPLYDEVFGKTEKGWLEVSPFHRLVSAGSPPWMGVCSLKRHDSCYQTKAYAQKLLLLGVPARLLELKNLSHPEADFKLGLPGPYTEAVENFMADLDEGVKKRLE